MSGACSTWQHGWLLLLLFLWGCCCAPCSPAAASGRPEVVHPRSLRCLAHRPRPWTTFWRWGGSQACGSGIETHSSTDSLSVISESPHSLSQQLSVSPFRSRAMVAVLVAVDGSQQGTDALLYVSKHIWKPDVQLDVVTGEPCTCKHSAVDLLRHQTSDMAACRQHSRSRAMNGCRWCLEHQ